MKGTVCVVLAVSLSGSASATAQVSSKEIAPRLMGAIVVEAGRQAAVRAAEGSQDMTIAPGWQLVRQLDAAGGN